MNKPWGFFWQRLATGLPDTGKAFSGEPTADAIERALASKQPCEPRYAYVIMWQHISTVPTDRVVLLCDAFGNRWTDNGDWQLANGCGFPPIAWMDLPEPCTEL